ncbi:hypothetical protein J14TS5_33190 [Paenibacillus lautus]|uniref:hypothetical protein n=1 Tax=Paenibacillus lautus TaxID=1401 RepID=UPI001B2D245F|nr:hypothetical protein [Paenibacillus lautus]GIO98233.1 hypothetical protein J14TS5_33190 [Paenibacillus lautus]
MEIKKGVVYVNDKKLDGFYGVAAKYGLTEQEYIDKQKESNSNFKLTQEENDFLNRIWLKLKFLKNIYLS